MFANILYSRKARALMSSQYCVVSEISLEFFNPQKLLSAGYLSMSLSVHVQLVCRFRRSALQILRSFIRGSLLSNTFSLRVQGCYQPELWPLFPANSKLSLCWGSRSLCWRVEDPPRRCLVNVGVVLQVFFLLQTINFHCLHSLETVVSYFFQF